MFSRKAIASGAWVSARYVAIALLGIITTTAFARLTDKETFGQYQFVVSLLALFSVFSLPGLNMATLKSVADKKPRAVIEAANKSFRSSLWAVPILVSYGVYLLNSGSTELGYAVIVSSMIFPFYYAPASWYAFYEGQSNFHPVAIRTVISSAFATSALLIGLNFGASLVALLVTFFGFSALFSGLYFFEVKRHVNSMYPESIGNLDVGYAQKVTAQKFVYTLSEALPVLVIAFFLNHESVALFQTANAFLVGVAGLLGSLAVISLPRIFSEKDSSHQDMFWKNIAVGLLASGAYLALVKLIFLPLYGSSYSQSFVLAQYLAILPLVISVRIFLVNFFTARDRNGLIVLVYVAANVLAVAALAVLSKSSGFAVTSASYLYALHLALALPLVVVYFFTASKKISSI